jgi:hypothetical protein
MSMEFMETLTDDESLRAPSGIGLDDILALCLGSDPLPLISSPGFWCRESWDIESRYEEVGTVFVYAEGMISYRWSDTLHIHHLQKSLYHPILAIDAMKHGDH